DALVDEEDAVGDERRELLATRRGPRPVRTGDQERELVAAEATADLARSERRRVDAPDFGQRGAAVHVAVAVDERLEAIHVGEEHGEALASLDGRVDAREEIARVAQTRE